MKALAIIVEGLGAAMLGPYGSSTSTTPAINRLAAQSLVLDQCFVDSFDLRLQLRSLWTAAHGSSLAPSTWNLWQALTERGIPAQLITDSSQAAEVAQTYGCPQITLVDVPAAGEAAESAEDCSLMHVFAVAMQQLANPETEGLVWIHARGLRHPWDAPLALRQAMTDPEDPAPPSSVELPDVMVDDETDPDLIVGWGQVAAAQVAVLDEAIDALEQVIAARDDAHQWAWLLASTGGTPLGEHGRIGRSRCEGYAEEIAVPAIVRPGEPLAVGVRRAELCQLPDLPLTLLVAMGWAEQELPSLWGRNLWQSGPPRMSTQWPVEATLAWLGHGEHTWIRTPAWSLLQTGDQPARLYVKPDDRWEVSDIAARRDDIVEQLTALLPALRSAADRSKRGALPQLDTALTSLQR
ncbi:MAG: hypothetical protein ACTHOU_07240 [Aureliella sp.]